MKTCLNNKIYFYLIENIDIKDLNKIYIGKTVNPIGRREKHRTKLGHQIIYNIIDEIEYCERKDWGWIESYWIEQFRQWGFILLNINKGGGPISHTLKSKEKIGKANSKPKPQSFKDYVRNNLERKIKISNTRLGINNKPKTPILKYDLNKNLLAKYESMTEAALKNNTGTGAIHGVCSGKFTRHRNFIFEYGK